MEKRLIDANSLKGDFLFLRKMWSGTEIIEMIDNAPTEDIDKVVRGLWLSYFDGDFLEPEMYFQCSRCSSRGHRIKWHYCPNCGTKMDW